MMSSSPGTVSYTHLPSNMQATLKALSSFHDRYANSDNGVESAEWVKYQIESMVALYQRKDITVVYVPTKGYKRCV